MQNSTIKQRREDLLRLRQEIMEDIKKNGLIQTMRYGKSELRVVHKGVEAILKIDKFLSQLDKGLDLDDESIPEVFDRQVFKTSARVRRNDSQRRAKGQSRNKKAV